MSQHPDKRPESLVREYIAGWLTLNPSRIITVISDDCEVVESDGTRYAGKKAIMDWVLRWIKEGNKVESWDITNLHATPYTVWMEWTFTCVCGGSRSSFEGASVVHLAGGQITSIGEYQRGEKAHSSMRLSVTPSGTLSWRLQG